MQLLHGDCLKLMEDIPTGSVDLILCDPPYGTTACDWDIVLPFDKMWAAYERIIKQNGAIVLFSQMPFAAQLVTSKPRLFRYEWIWEKDSPVGYFNAHKMPLRAHENILVFYKKLPKYNPQMRTGFAPYTRKRKPARANVYGASRSSMTVSTGERFPVDILKFIRPKDRGLHPTQKPVPLLEYLIKTYTDPGHTVLDNCMGSGSTGVACVNTGRRFIGMELNQLYFDIARKRIEEASKIAIKLH